MRGSTPVLSHCPASTPRAPPDSFLTAIKAAGVELKWGKHLSFKTPNSKRPILCAPITFSIEVEPSVATVPDVF